MASGKWQVANGKWYKIDGGGRGCSICYYAIILKNDPEELKRLLEVATAFAGECCLAKRDSQILHLILEEIYINIVSYAFDGSERHYIHITLQKNADQLLLEICDDGRPFNPLEAEAPDTGKKLMAREPGGLGIYLVKNFSDDIQYKRDRQSNRLIIKKAIQ